MAPEWLPSCVVDTMGVYDIGLGAKQAVCVAHIQLKAPKAHRRPESVVIRPSLV